MVRITESVMKNGGSSRKVGNSWVAVICLHRPVRLTGHRLQDFNSVSRYPTVRFWVSLPTNDTYFSIKVAPHSGSPATAVSDNAPSQSCAS